MFDRAKDALLWSRPAETLASKVVSFALSGDRALVEHRERWGDEHPGTTYYVIRRPNLWGIMSVLVVFANHIHYARRRGYVPVIDMCNAQSLYLDDAARGGGVNAWEYYFEQPAGLGLADIAGARNVILSNLHVVSATRNSYAIDHATLTSNNEAWHELARRHFRLNATTSAHVRRVGDELFLGREASTLGVYCRGTDYVDARPKNHPVQPGADQVIDKAREVMARRGYSFVYLVTEDERIFDRFQNAFGERLLAIDAPRYGVAPAGQTYIWQRTHDRANHRYLSGLEYLTGMLLLHRCRALIGGVTGGTCGLRLLQDRPYEYEYYWDLGHY